MTVPLAKKVDGKKFMWDGATYDSPDQAQQAREGYEQEGFEVQVFDEEGGYLVYTRRLATDQTPG